MAESAAEADRGRHPGIASFNVRAGGPGSLAERSATGEILVDDTIAQQLAVLYRKLVEREPFSEVARVELSTAGASGRAARLLICQCDTDGLELHSFFRRWWVVDAVGLHADAQWPLSNAMVQQEGWENDFPFIKFASDGRRVRFGLKFGDRWYVVKEGPIGDDGRFVPEQLVQEYSCVG